MGLEKSERVVRMWVWWWWCCRIVRWKYGYKINYNDWVELWYYLITRTRREEGVINYFGYNIFTKTIRIGNNIVCTLHSSPFNKYTVIGSIRFGWAVYIISYIILVQARIYVCVMLYTNNIIIYVIKIVVLSTVIASQICLYAYYVTILS